jgi:hypothetical protein
MTPKDFCCWLQRYFELEGDGSALDEMVPTGPFYYESMKYTNPTVTYVGHQPSC